MWRSLFAQHAPHARTEGAHAFKSADGSRIRRAYDTAEQWHELAEQIATLQSPGVDNAPPEMGPPPLGNSGFQRGPPLSTKPSKPSGARYDLSGLCEGWETSGRRPAPKARR